MIRVAVLAPIKTSLYARLVAHLAAVEPGVDLTGVIVRTPWTLGRMRGEIRRDGARLLWKAYRKMVLGDAAYRPSDEESIRGLARRVNLPGRTLDDVAAAHGFRLTVVKDHNDPEALEALASGRPDVVAFTGGGLLRKGILAIPRIGILNCHLGVLPPYRGMDVVEWPVVERDRDDEPPQIGMTVHLMDQGLDTGPILLEQPIDIRPNDTFAAIRARMEPAMVDSMMRAIRRLRDGSAEFIEQTLDQGRQYFVMHPRMQAYANERLCRYVATLESRRH